MVQVRRAPQIVLFLSGRTPGAPQTLVSNRQTPVEAPLWRSEAAPKVGPPQPWLPGDLRHSPEDTSVWPTAPASWGLCAFPPDQQEAKVPLTALRSRCRRPFRERVLGSPGGRAAPFSPLQRAGRRENRSLRRLRPHPPSGGPPSPDLSLEVVPCCFWGQLGRVGVPQVRRGVRGRGSSGALGGGGGREGRAHPKSRIRQRRPHCSRNPALG